MLGAAEFGEAGPDEAEGDEGEGGFVELRETGVVEAVEEARAQGRAGDDAGGHPGHQERVVDERESGGAEEDPIQAAIERLGAAPSEAEAILDDTDHNRDRYHRQYYDRDWNDPELYHMILNTELLGGAERAAHLVIAHARSVGW